MKFFKYHGTGNDFIMIDNRTAAVKLTQNQILHACHRRFGIGADGLILLQKHEQVDFEMIYYNSDGRPSSMCGNGGRCIAAFATDLGITGENGLLKFMAVDGYHEAAVVQKLPGGYQIDLLMQDVKGMHNKEDVSVLNTGSPHYVKRVDDTDRLSFIAMAHEIRYSDAYANDGINVNFFQWIDADIKMRTYERGVEDETWSCGTGVVAASIAAFKMNDKKPAHIHTKGGLLEVDFIQESDDCFTHVHLIGPALRVFEGEMSL